MQFFVLALSLLVISRIHAGSNSLARQFLISQFALVKCILEDITGLKAKHEFFHTILIVIPSFLLAIILTLCSCVLVLIFWVYKQIANVILKLTLGENYGGLVTGCNVSTTLLEGKERGVVTVVVVFDYNKDGEAFYEMVKNRVKEKVFESNKYKMLLTIRKFFMNYMYLYKKDFELEEIVKRIDNYPGDKLTKDNLVTFMNKHCHMDLPCNNHGNFDIQVGTQPLNTYKNQNGIKQYPLIFRMHHLLADGFIIYNILADIFCINQEGDDYSSKFIKKSSKTKKPIMEIIKAGWNMICQVYVRAIVPKLYQPDVFIDGSIKKESDTIMSFLIEDEEKYVKIAKDIKKRIPGLPFFAIPSAAFSASLAEYIKKHTRPDDVIPEVISAALPIQMHSDRLTKCYSNSMNVFENDFSVFYMDLCIVPKGKRDVPIEDYILDRLLIIGDEFKDVANSADSIVNYMLMKVYLSVFPWSLSRLLLSLGQMTVALSSIPGGPIRQTFYGSNVRDVLFFLPKQLMFGLACSILTYDNRFQIGLKGNKDMLKDTKAIDSILQGVFKYLDILDEKTKDLELKK